MVKIRKIFMLFIILFIIFSLHCISSAFDITWNDFKNSYYCTDHTSYMNAKNNYSKDVSISIVVGAKNDNGNNKCLVTINGQQKTMYAECISKMAYIMTRNSSWKQDGGSPEQNALWRDYCEF